ncbi:MAG: SAM-dependent methyltransferase [Lachnospiraceae bacterium]|nr:SAM-dependent methyltransferase [Lachnospiraceae bacterium]
MNTLSDRLGAVASMTEDAVADLRREDPNAVICVADIGTDHGYLPIWLIEQGIASHAVAMDLREGPLSRARSNIELMGLSDRIETRISDGFAALKSGEAQIAVLAGMGGRLMKRMIIEIQPATLGIRQMILQPQSEAPELWQTIRENGWTVIDERMIYEDGKFYTMMRAILSESYVEGMRSSNDFGVFLQEGSGETYQLFLEKELESTRNLIDKLLSQNGPAERIAELRIEEANIEAALTACEGKQREA